MTVFQASPRAYIPRFRKCLHGLKVDHRDRRKGVEFCLFVYFLMYGVHRKQSFLMSRVTICWTYFLIPTSYQTLSTVNNGENVLGEVTSMYEDPEARRIGRIHATT